MNNENNLKLISEQMTDEKLESDYSSKHRLPKPPKPGELIICQFCGEPIYPKELSRDKDIRKKELKWHYHNRCIIGVAFQADYQTKDIWRDRYSNKDSFHTKVAKELKKINDAKRNKK